MKGVQLNAREYKLLLDASKFKAAPSLALANSFWENRIVPIIAARQDRQSRSKKSKLTKLGSKMAGREMDVRHPFAQGERRKVVFWDTEDGVLAANSFSLRQRETDKDDSKAEVTLKLRTPDLFIAAATELPGTQRDSRSKLEEDIAPLAVGGSGSGKNAKVRLANPPSMRSRFSLSTKQATQMPKSIGQLLELYPTLESNLQASGIKRLARSMILVHGNEIEEHVFEGAEVAIGEGFECKFALTLWYFHAKPAVPAAAEISFKCELRDGGIPLGPATRAFELFVALQLGLGSMIEAEGTSKTALALPRRVGAP